MSIMAVFRYEFFCRLYQTFSVYSFRSPSKNMYSDIKILKPNKISFKSIIHRNFSRIASGLLDEEGNVKTSKGFIKGNGVVVKKKYPTTLKVTIYYLNGSRTTMFYEEAEKLAKRSGLKLNKVSDSGDKPAYAFAKLNDSGNSDGKKKIKNLIIKTEALDHDIEIKINKINKLLEKGKPICITIQKHDDNVQKAEDIFNKVEKGIINCTIKNKSSDKRKLRFEIFPEKAV